MNYFNLILSNQSILRILQFQALSKTNLFGEVIEFGANDIIDKNFVNLKKDKCNITYSNIKTKNKDFIKIDLQKKFKLKKKYDFVVIFNVLEHLSDPELAFKNIHHILKDGGCIIGSTPFLFRVHGAPKDFLRFTQDYLRSIIKKNKFKKIKIKELGTGPFLASVSMLRSYLKYLPILFQIYILISLILDKFLNIVIKTNPSKIYPIGYYFEAVKKIK